MHGVYIPYVKFKKKKLWVMSVGIIVAIIGKPLNLARVEFEGSATFGPHRCSNEGFVYLSNFKILW